MKSGALLTVLGVIGCAGYFGYEWWHDRKVQKEGQAAQANLQRERDASKRKREGGSEDVARPGPAPTGDSAGLRPDPAGSASGSEPGSEPQVPWTTVVPDLTGLTPEQAKEVLSKAGIDVSKFSVLEASSCPYDSDKDMLPKGVICTQSPALPAEITPHQQITVAIERDDYEAGQIGSPMEWKRMPTLVGMTESEAKSTLARKGFPTDQFEFVYRPGCGAKGTVCYTQPDSEARKVKARKGTVTVAR